MRLSYRSSLRFISLLAGMAIIIGCATTPFPPVPAAMPRPLPPIAPDSAWWYARFQMNWREEATPSWQMDLLIADLIVRPSLERHEQEIFLWRFHRRAARDTAGHQFSFIFFAAAGVAQEIYSELSSHPVLEEARRAGLILDLKCDDTQSATKPAIGDTSDPRWPAPLQQSWPYYLMGASRMWLDLISRMVPGDPNAESVSTIDDLERRYAEANASITDLWQKEGSHAFLHHLNALFGYEPLIVIEKRQMRF